MFVGETWLSNCFQMSVTGVGDDLLDHENKTKQKSSWRLHFKNVVRNYRMVEEIKREFGNLTIEY